MVWDKIFIVMSNLYFFNQSKWMQMGFNVAFYSVLILDFTGMFPVRAATAQHEEYLAKSLA